jgi:hypothetical protein
MVGEVQERRKATVQFGQEYLRRLDLYINAVTSVGMADGVQYETKGKGIVVCIEEGKFFDTESAAE